MIEDWREDYNTYRPHSSLRNLTPTEYAASCRAPLPRTEGGQSWGRAEGALSDTTASITSALPATPAWSTAESG